MSSTTEEFAAERAMLGSRDREQLHEIASAMGVRGATRLRKADLVEAILAAATSGNGIPEPSAEKPKKRATRKKDAGNGDAAGEAGTAVAEDVPAPAPAPAPEPPAQPAPPPFSFGPGDRSKEEVVADATTGGDEAPAAARASDAGEAPAASAEGSARATA
ncbi:MAG: Rho termination factor N-terminal domain-containing protein, partial [Acidimicrobiia bacterium]